VQEYPLKDRPEELQKRPAGQLAHEASAVMPEAPEKVATGQAAGAAEPAMQYVPAEQRLARGLLEPLAHQYPA
jgi:hypothetical protein